MASSQPQTPAVQYGDNMAMSDLALPGSCDSGKVINNLSVDQNAGYPISAPTTAVFRTNTVAPSPPPTAFAKPDNHATLSELNSASHPNRLDQHRHSPLGVELYLQTNVITGGSVTSAADNTVSSAQKPIESDNRSQNPMGHPLRTSSLKKALSGNMGIGSQIGSAPNSALSSPMLNAMANITPLPSPLMSGDSPGPWKTLTSRPTSREYMMTGVADSALVTSSGESISSAILNQSKRRAYQVHGFTTNSNETPNDMMTNREMKGDGHARNRSISEYVPEAVQVPKTRHQTVSGSHATIADSTSDSTSPAETHMRRERNLAVERGITPMQGQENILPTPPASRTGAESSDSDSSVSNIRISLPRARKPRYEYFDAHTLNDEKRRRWRAIKTLGQGTFSKVVLATSQTLEEEERIDEDNVSGDRMDGITRQIEPKIDRRKLVAIKICEHGPKGGASEERVEMSLKRELEIMKSIHHPSLVHLKAWNIEESRAILVLSYCPGGDLFEVASEHQDLLVPSLLQRMFSELVAALQYLHERHIVHRDVKLENVLVNLPLNELAKPVDWVTYPYSVVTLTDLGLSRRVTDDEKLTTRCGSDDYAAPEVIMGQPYDGRAVDAWSLGVLLYALLESRLPFDPTPGMSEGHKQRSKTSHRIARVEWRWVEFAGDDGDHEGNIAKFERAGLKGAMDITEGLLKRARSRWSIQKVGEESWVKDAIKVEGGLRFREEDTPEEVT